MMRRINRAFFFDTVRHALFKGSLNEGQVEGMTALLDAWEAKMPGADDRWLAYMLATAFHETAFTMQPVRETLAETDDRAIEILDSAFARGKLSWVKTVYWRKDEDGKSWLGRGLVQLTHKRNYEAMSKVTGIDLVADADRAMEMDIAVTILMEGMLQGFFTKHKLSDHLNATTEDWVNARRIVNGLDRAEQIGGYGRSFHAAIAYLPDVAQPAASGWLKRLVARVIAALTGKTGV